VWLLSKRATNRNIAVWADVDIIMIPDDCEREDQRGSVVEKGLGQGLRLIEAAEDIRSALCRGRPVLIYQFTRGFSPPSLFLTSVERH
jgi:hypothetical protein